MVHIFELCIPRSVGLYISHIAHMPFGRLGSRMRFAGWIKMSASRTRIGCAAIAEFMDMKAMVARSKATDFGPDLHAIGHFGECNSAAHLVSRGRMKHRNGFQRFGRFSLRRLGLRGEAANQE